MCRNCLGPILFMFYRFSKIMFTHKCLILLGYKLCVIIVTLMSLIIIVGKKGRIAPKPIYVHYQP